MATMTAQTEIQQAVIYRCTNKDTRKVFYVIKSDSKQDTWYTISFNYLHASWVCNCPATKPCKHIRAVLESLQLRRARLAEKIGGDMPAVIATIEREQAARPAQCNHWKKHTLAGDYAPDGGCFYCYNNRLAEQKARLVPARQCETWGGDDDTALYGPVLAITSSTRATMRAAAARQAGEALLRRLKGRQAFEEIKAQVRAIESGIAG